MSLLAGLVLCAPVPQEQLPAAPRIKPPHPLLYVPSVEGLKPPTFEGGRTEFEMGDVDGDGNVDIVSVGDHGSPFIGTDQHGVMVWLGNGQGGFSVVMTGDLGYGGIALGDVNGDGLMDVGYGVHHDYSSDDLGDQLLEVALGDGTAASWTPWDDGLATSGETWGMFGTDFGDVDSDGDLDVGSNSFGCCAGTHVYLNHGDGTWTQSFGFLGGNSNMDFVFCDFDGDGHLDFATANGTGLAYRGDGAGGFVNATGALATIGLPVRGLDAGDVDGDGRDELAFVDGGVVQVWSYVSGDLWAPKSLGLPPGGSYDLAQLHDLDVNGTVDLAAFGNGELSIWRGDGVGGWLPRTGGSLPGSGSKNGEAFRVGGDVDHNGFADMVVLQEQGGAFSSVNTMYLLREASTPAVLSIAAVEPTANRVWRGGQVRFVDWHSGVPGSDAGTVTVELSTTGTAGPWTTLGAGVPNNGRLQVVVPSAVDSIDCRVRLTVQTTTGSATAFSSAFAIAP